MSTARRSIRWLLLVALVAGVGLGVWKRYAPPADWTEDERVTLRSLWIESLPALPADPSNPVADDMRAAALGHRLFFDPRFSATGTISCSTCHQPIRNFTDGLPRGVAIGMSARNTPSIVGSAYSPWLYWDGRKDSQWAQALAPLEDPNEHGADRIQVLGIIASDPSYRSAYETLFGAPPDPLDESGIDEAFANIGKAIAAYERLLVPGPSPFDEYVAHVEAGGDYRDQPYLDDAELHGLRLFIGEARCTECHNGPLFTNNEFHNTGLLSPSGELPDRGRIDGVRSVQADAFNCLGEFSEASDSDCAELEFVRTGIELLGATRTPSLRGLGKTAPYQSRGQHETLTEVLEHYNEAPLAMIGHNEATPLSLSRRELRQLEAFLISLEAPPGTETRWLEAPQGESSAQANP